MTIDLSFFNEPPELSHEAGLEISALAPLSMVSSQPGTYFRSEISPTVQMLYGMLENVMGWHFDAATRKELFKRLQKAAKKKHGKKAEYKDSAWLSAKPEEAESGFSSLLQFHLSIEEEDIDTQPLAYDDLWSMLLHSKGETFIGGSRNYDWRIEELITRSRGQDKSKPINPKTKKHPPFISFGDKSQYKTYSLEELPYLLEGEVNTSAVKPYFPYYYSSPKSRGYVVPAKAYRYKLSCTEQLAHQIKKAIAAPAAPPYLGTNDGWIDLKWIDHEAS